MDGCLKIPPFVLQDIGPLGPLPKKDVKRQTDMERQTVKEKEIKIRPMLSDNH